jgi:hypothetical protein
MQKIRAIKGEKMKESPMMMESIADTVRYPYFSIELKHLPEAKDWKIGEKYTVMLELKQTGLNINSGKHGEHGSAQFDVVGISPCCEEDADDEDEDDSPKRYSRQK